MGSETCPDSQDDGRQESGRASGHDKKEERKVVLSRVKMSIYYLGDSVRNNCASRYILQKEFFVSRGSLSNFMPD
jgi:hypothetical protein